FASAFSLYGCWRDCGEDCHSKAASQNIDAEPGSNVAPKLEGCTGYLLQIMYQVAAGAVLLTDVVFWLLIYPFLTGKDYRLAFVRHSGFVAHPMLWSLCSDSQIKAPMAFKIIFRVLSGYKVIRIRSVNFVQENTSPCKD
uniref:Uncharacterized protein n=1 Tax=Chenopodium quinoa TaxID=63459 RepID=A0A803L0M4_CHEQI